MSEPLMSVSRLLLVSWIGRLCWVTGGTILSLNRCIYGADIWRNASYRLLAIYSKGYRDEGKKKAKKRNQVAKIKWQKYQGATPIYLLTSTGSKTRQRVLLQLLLMKLKPIDFSWPQLLSLLLVFIHKVAMTNYLDMCYFGMDFGLIIAWRQYCMRQNKKRVDTSEKW